MPTHLIDVRTPEEYATGFLPNSTNIPYQSISTLTTRSNVQPTDEILLYCRSGRRSKIAEKELKELGFGRARDIGSLEEAREVLRVEASMRPLEKQNGGEGKRVDKEELKKASDKLLEGLRGLEE